MIDKTTQPDSSGEETRNKTDPEIAHFLWHLQSLGIVTHDLKSPLWDKIDPQKAEVRVAIIDNGIDAEHPNLQCAIAIDSEMDFSSHLYGTTYLLPVEEEHSPIWKQMEAKNTELKNAKKAITSPFKIADRLTTLGVELTQGLEDIASHWDDANNHPAAVPTRNPSRYFAAHGTACAGLVGGRPRPGSHLGFCPDQTTQVKCAEPMSSRNVGRNGLDHDVPYFGANPFCKIIPICTPYSHEILPVIHALFHAIINEADIILMPRGVAHPDDHRRFPGNKKYGTRISLDRVPTGVSEDHAQYAILNEHRIVFEYLLRELSKTKYIVLAAGNDGNPEELAYPASIIGGFRVSEILAPGKRRSHQKPGEHGPGLIVVSAVNRNGRASSYSNGSARPDVVPVLSDDGFLFNRRELRVDSTTQFYEDYDLSVHNSTSEIDQSPWGILSLDVSGKYGYTEGYGGSAPEQGRDGDRDSLYTIFGGTSAASSIAAGCISLVMQMEALPKGKPLDRNKLLAKLNNAGITLAPKTLA